MNRCSGPWNRTYIYRLLCGRNSGLQGMTSQLLLFGTVEHQSLYDSPGPPVTVFKQPG
jgi:hypothetical protein